MPGGKQKRFVSLCFPDVNVICECTFPWIERRHQIGINTEKPLRMLRGSSLQRLTNEKLIHKKNYGPAQKPSLPESTTLHFTRIWFLMESNENVDHTHTQIVTQILEKTMLIVVRNDSGAGTPARKTTKVLEFWWFHGPRCWNVMTPFAHGIKWSTEDSIDVMDAWVCLGGVRPAAGSENFSIFSFACLCRITRRWTFFTTPCRSCSRSLLSWVGHDTLQKEMDIELDPRRANCIKWSQIYIYVQQTSGCFHQELWIVPKFFEHWHVNLQVCVDVSQPFSDGMVRWMNRHADWYWFVKITKPKKNGSCVCFHKWKMLLKSP